MTDWTLLDRLKEPSTWASIGSFLGMVGVTLPGGVMQAIPLLGAAAALIAGVVLREGK